MGANEPGRPCDRTGVQVRLRSRTDRGANPMPRWSGLSMAGRLPGATLRAMICLDHRAATAVALAGAFALAAAAADVSEPPASPSDADATPENATAMRADPARLLAKLHRQNALEIQLGELARTRGSARAVRALGHRLVDDHRMCDRRVVALAQRKGYSLQGPPEPEPGAKRLEQPRPEDEQKVVVRLRALHGVAFDRALLDVVATDHAETIGELVAARTVMQDEETLHLLQSLIPILNQQHMLAVHVRARIPAAG